MLDKPISVGESGTTLSATVGLFSLESRKYMFLKCDIFLLFTKLEKENLKKKYLGYFQQDQETSAKVAESSYKVCSFLSKLW